MTERGPAMVRIALLGVLFAALGLALLQPSSAGTSADPEVTDPAGDGQVGLAVGDRDLVRVYIQDTLVAGDPPEVVFVAELAADIQQTSSFHSVQERIRIAFIPTNPGGLPAGAVEAYVAIRLGFVQQGAPAESAACSFGTTTAVGGSRGVSQEVAGVSAFTPAHYECRIPVSLIGGFDSTAGHKITGLYGQFQLVQRGPLSGTIPDDPAGVNVLRTYDRAPDTGIGRDFPPGNVTGNQTAGDSDNDGLNDTCEQDYFGDLNSTHNGTGDADGDGLSNQHECDLGTDPTNPDTDGDGVNDKDDPFPSDPPQGGNTTGSQPSTSTSQSSTSGTASVTSTSGSSSSTGTGDEADLEVKSLGDAVEKLQSDLDYLGTSAGGMVAVLLLAILALAVRWSL